MFIKTAQNAQTVEECSFLYPELTDWEKSLGLGILQKYPQFKQLTHALVTIDLLGYATDRCNPFNLCYGDQDTIERDILGGLYKFLRRCMSDKFPEKFNYDSLDKFRTERHFRIYYTPKYDGFAEMKTIV